MLSNKHLFGDRAHVWASGHMLACCLLAERAICMRQPFHLELIHRGSEFGAGLVRPLSMKKIDSNKYFDIYELWSCFTNMCKESPELGIALQAAAVCSSTHNLAEISPGVEIHSGPGNIWGGSWSSHADAVSLILKKKYGFSLLSVSFW